MSNGAQNNIVDIMAANWGDLPKFMQPSYYAPYGYDMSGYSDPTFQGVPSLAPGCIAATVSASSPNDCPTVIVFPLMSSNIIGSGVPSVQLAGIGGVSPGVPILGIIP